MLRVIRSMVFGGNDQLSGGGSGDFLHGGYGNDQLIGGPGDDLPYGSLGADSFRCGPGNDRIRDFTPSEGDTKSNDCESIGFGNETLSRGPSNGTLSANNFSSR